VQSLRENLYASLVPIANDWMRELKSDVRFPATHQQFLHDCFESEQKRPTALLLKYGAAISTVCTRNLRSRRFSVSSDALPQPSGRRVSRREVVLTEQRPRAQSRAHALAPEQGDLLVLPSRLAPRSGTNGTYRVAFRHA